MTNETSGNATTEPRPAAVPSAPGRRQVPKRTWVVGAVAATLAVGAAGLSLARGGDTSLTPVVPTAIASLASSATVAAKGEVAEVYGNKFVMQDGTGRALVETGRDGEDGKLVAKGETVTVQGRFENGFLHARLIGHTDGNTVTLGPVGGPPPGPPGPAGDRVGVGLQRPAH